MQFRYLTVTARELDRMYVTHLKQWEGSDEPSCKECRVIVVVSIHQGEILPLCFEVPHEVGPCMVVPRGECLLCRLLQRA